MGDEDHRFARLRQCLQHLLLQFPFQHGIHGGKWFVQEDHFRILCCDACHGSPLFLPAGQLARKPVLKICDAELFEERIRGGPCGFSAHTRQNILTDSHVREQGIILEHIARVPLLRDQIDLLRGVKQNSAAKRDGSLVRALDPGDTLESHRFAAPGRPQQREDPVLSLQICLKEEIPYSFSDMYLQFHLISFRISSGSHFSCACRLSGSWQG